MDRTQLLNALWTFQDAKGYISDKDVEDLAHMVNTSKIDIEGIISFYHFFRRKPAGKFTIYLNNSIVSEIKGFAKVKAAFEKETGVRFDEQSSNPDFLLRTTSCIGLSDQEPAALINQYPFTDLTPEKVMEIIYRLKAGDDPAEFADSIPDNVRYSPGEEKAIIFRPYQMGDTVKQLKNLDSDEVIDRIKKAGISGMGGAFFPTAMKWKLCRDSKNGFPKYIICNADEGEPGTFKDRVLLRKFPGLVLEGMIVAGFTTGAKEGIVYLRAEYKYLLERLEKTIEELESKNLLGKNIAGIEGFDFHLRVQLGAGAYICGEETALIESLEGKRGEPRTKEFFPTDRGFLNKPTVVNNVETFAFAARTIELGQDFIHKTGTKESPGTKLLSISGDCKFPGIYEIEWGTSVHDVLELCGADDPYYIQVSGPSGTCITENENHRKIDRGDLPCGGSFMIFNKSRDVFDILHNFAAFFKHESCGTCTPCRAGNHILEQKIAKFQRSLCTSQDLQEIQSWGKITKTASRCGLGQMSPNSILAAADKFRHEFQKRIPANVSELNKVFDEAVAIFNYDQLIEKTQDN